MDVILSGKLKKQKPAAPSKRSLYLSGTLNAQIGSLFLDAYITSNP